ncbi:MAG: GDP-mannose 4,6-dehydratase, partial [Planctomycetaceae bacterium]|nr:GDP-mannose 4,6-dehydratase [Planctomycetaceae bacterium]
MNIARCCSRAKPIVHTGYGIKFKPMKRYLITGVSGFVGQHFLKYLDTVDEQIEVVGIDLVSGGYAPVNYSYRFEAADVFATNALRGVCADFQPNYILHLAAISSVRESLNDPEKILTNNICATLGVLLSLEAVVRESCRVLVVGSSEVYAESSELLDETSPCSPRNPYAYSKLAGESIIKSYCDKVNFDFDVVMTRSFMHTGTNQNEKFVVASFVKQLCDAKRKNEHIAKLETGNIDISRDITDVRDVVRGYYLLLKHGRRGEKYNVCSGTAVSLRSIIDLASNLLNIQVAIATDPKRLRANDLQLVVGNNKKIHKETGWQPEIKLSQT